MDRDDAPWSLAAAEPDETRITRMRELIHRGFDTVEPPPVRGAALIRRLPRWLPGLVRSTGTTLLRPSSRRKFARAQEQSTIRLHLGCGWSYKPGWINIDLFLTKADIAWDLTHGIPFADASADAIFHQHLMEHLTLPQGYALAQESLRALKPGGILRVGVPDAGACIASYAGLRDPHWANSQPTGLLAVQALFYEHGHRAMYDAQTLVLLLRAAGFRDVRAREWQDSDLAQCPDSEAREHGTLFVECIR